MAHFFTADTHFADDPVRRFFRRPFASIEAMGAAMIVRAGVVGADDDLWIIGDFAACAAMRPSMTPGATTLTVMPRLAISRASDFEAPCRPALAAA